MADGEIEQEIDKINKILSENKVANITKNVWGKKELTYPIEKFTDGYYVQYNFELTPEATNKVSSKLRLEEKIIRFLIMKQEKVQKHTEQKEESQKTVKKDDTKKDKKKEVKVEEKKENNEKDFNKKLDEALEKDLTD
jgi:small subunit ribosomal protein S6